MDNAPHFSLVWIAIFVCPLTFIPGALGDESSDISKHAVGIVKDHRDSSGALEQSVVDVLHKVIFPTLSIFVLEPTFL